MMTVQMVGQIISHFMGESWQNAQCSAQPPLAHHVALRRLSEEVERDGYCNIYIYMYIYITYIDNDIYKIMTVDIFTAIF